MVPYCLTRFLYPIDEVCLSLLTALVDQRSLDECYYWAAEIHASHFDLMSFLWTLYLDFYAELNPRLEGLIRRKWNSGGGLQAACHVIRNMHRARPTLTVFVIRQTLYYGPLPARCGHPAATWGGPPAPVPGFPATHAPWLSAVKDGHKWRAATELYKLADSWCIDSLFQVLVDFHSEQMNGCVKKRAMEKYWGTRPGNDDLHHLLAVMVHLWRPESEIDMRKVFVAPGTDAMKYGTTPGPFCRPDRVLARARLFKVDPAIGVFSLARTTVGDVRAVLRQHWLYYAYRCPLWRERILTTGGYPDHQSSSIAFRTDEGFHAFHGLYGLEPDEQSEMVQALSTSPVCDLPARSWLSNNGVTGLEAIGSGDWKFQVEIDSSGRALPPPHHDA